MRNPCYKPNMLRNTVLLVAVVWTLGAQDGAQRFASLGDLKLESGEVVHDCRIGYRTYGQLDASKSNAILFPTWFGGTTAQLAGNFTSGGLAHLRGRPVPGTMTSRRGPAVLLLRLY